MCVCGVVCVCVYAVFYTCVCGMRMCGVCMAMLYVCVVRVCVVCVCMCGVVCDTYTTHACMHVSIHKCSIRVIRVLQTSEIKWSIQCSLSCTLPYNCSVVNYGLSGGHISGVQSTFLL